MFLFVYVNAMLFVGLFFQDVKEEDKTKDNGPQSYASAVESFRSISTVADAERLETLINQVTSGTDDEISPIVLDPSSDKSKRTV